MVRSLAVALGLACCSLVLGCGLRGPLYLPEDKARTEAEAAQPAAPGDAEKIITPQPAPQAQKKERAAGTPDPQPAPPAN